VGGVEDLAQVVGRHVRVDLGGRHVGVAEHLLHAAQVGAALQQVRGEAVPERVQADLAGHAGGAQVTAQDVGEALPGQGPAAGVQEQLIVAALA
jgi:hypothetical protein